jgi:4a-hydroxytetrahydrobiopterin dehydratase
VRDLQGSGPALWFQRTDAHDEPRQRFHLDVRVPPEVAGPRIEAALAAGGTLVSDAHAPAFTVLADPPGNKVCVTTGLGRD